MLVTFVYNIAASFLVTNLKHFFSVKLFFVFSSQPQTSAEAATLSPFSSKKTGRSTNAKNTNAKNTNAKDTNAKKTNAKNTYAQNNNVNNCFCRVLESGAELYS